MRTEKDVVGNITALVALFEHAAPLYQYFMIYCHTSHSQFHKLGYPPFWDKPTHLGMFRPCPLLPILLRIPAIPRTVAVVRHVLLTIEQTQGSRDGLIKFSNGYSPPAM